MVVVAAFIKVQEGKAKEFETEFFKLQKKVVKDPGCLTYIMHRAVDDPNTFFFFERYENDEAVKYHTSTEHFKSFFKRMGPIMKGKPEIHSYQEVEPQ